MEPFPALPQVTLRTGLPTNSGTVDLLSTPTHSGRSIHWCFAVGDRRPHTTTEGVWSQRALSCCSPWAAVGRQTELVAVRV